MICWWQYLITRNSFFFSDIKQIYIFKWHYLPTWRNYSEVECEFRVQQFLSPDGETCTTQSVRDKGPCWRWFWLFQWNLLPKLRLLLEVALQSHFQQAAVLSGGTYVSLCGLETVPSCLWNRSPCIFCVRKFCVHNPGFTLPRILQISGMSWYSLASIMLEKLCSSLKNLKPASSRQKCSRNFQQN